MPLTDTAIRKAKPTSKTQRLFDGGGMYLEISPAGGKWWRLKYRFNGKEKRLSLGTYPDTSLANARIARDEARKLLATGIDPSQHRKASRAASAEQAANSFEVVAREWLAKMAAHEWVETQTQKVVSQLARYVFPWLGQKPICSIGVSDLRPLIERPAKAGHMEVAHRLRANLSRIFKYAIATDRADSDPAAALSAVLPPRRITQHLPTIIDPVRIGDLLRAIEGFSGTLPVACALKVAPLWMCRPVEIRTAEWEHFNLDGPYPTYTVPTSNRKLRRREKEHPDTMPHAIPLSTQAIAILHELRPLTGRGKYLFPGARDPKRHMSNGAVNAALARIGFKGEITGHGFRHMASTRLNEMGWKADAIERQLSHKDKDRIRDTYNLAQYMDERRQMMQAWADYLDTLKADTDKGTSVTTESGESR